MTLIVEKIHGPNPLEIEGYDHRARSSIPEGTLVAEIRAFKEIEQWIKQEGFEGFLWNGMFYTNRENAIMIALKWG